MGVPVAFNFAVWQARYSEFRNRVDAPLAALYFAEACLYHDNTGMTRHGPQDPNEQLLLLNMLTAHIAALNVLGADGQNGSPLVGRINNASEGSVSVQTDDYITNPSDLSAFFNQTKYGAAYWGATAKFRTMRYRPGRKRSMNPWGFLFGGRS